MIKQELNNCVNSFLFFSSHSSISLELTEFIVCDNLIPLQSLSPDIYRNDENLILCNTFMDITVHYDNHT